MELDESLASVAEVIVPRFLSVMPRAVQQKKRGTERKRKRGREKEKEVEREREREKNRDTARRQRSESASD